MIETVLTYLYFLPFYPIVVIGYALESGIFLHFLIWLVVGCFIGHCLRQIGKNYLFLTWLIIWFMPGTIICGSATMVPWFATILVTFNPGGCASLFSVGFSLVANTLIIFGLQYIYVWYKRRKITA